MSPKPPPGAGTGYVRFDEGPLVPTPAPMSAQPVNQVLLPGPPACCATPLPVGPVVDSVADQLRALELFSSFMDPLRLRRFVLGWFPPLCLSLLSHPSLPTGFLRKNWLTSVNDKKSYKTKLSEQRVKVAEEERVLERMQADLVGLVGEVSDLDEEILELRRTVSVVLEPEDMDASDGSNPRPAMRKRSRAVSAVSQGT